ncbi:hypothetical protein ZWY2020_018158 [Hordeum vulgare]|nr:hypothetical protein ZWY2020_018158 [Hordeum vulgare]
MLWKNPIHVASVSSSVDSLLCLHGISVPPQTTFWPSLLVTGGTTSPVTTGMEPGDHVAIVVSTVHEAFDRPG